MKKLNSVRFQINKKKEKCGHFTMTIPINPSFLHFPQKLCLIPIELLEFLITVHILEESLETDGIDMTLSTPRTILVRPDAHIVTFPVLPDLVNQSLVHGRTVVMILGGRGQLRCSHDNERSKDSVWRCCGNCCSSI